nr:fatty acyl-CoA hydrolase precursor, medium chain-like [Anolis sagrei ordinatus]
MKEPFILVPSFDRDTNSDAKTRSSGDRDTDPKRQGRKSWDICQKGIMRTDGGGGQGPLAQRIIDREHCHIIIKEYLKDFQDPFQLRDRVLEALGDVVLVAPAVLAARHHRDAGHPTYVYEFQHSPSWQAGLRPDFVQADHGDELFFVFGKPFLAGEGTDKERNLSKTMMKYWANFARKGDPNGAGLVAWPSYSQEEQYLDIGLKQRVAKKLKEGRVRFWSQTLPEKVAEGREGHREL